MDFIGKRHREEEFDITLPDYTLDLKVISKMPDCPNCELDELGMLGPNLAYCGLSICRRGTNGDA